MGTIKIVIHRTMKKHVDGWYNPFTRTIHVNDGRDACRGCEKVECREKMLSDAKLYRVINHEMYHYKREMREMALPFFLMIGIVIFTIWLLSTPLFPPFPPLFKLFMALGPLAMVIGIGIALKWRHEKRAYRYGDSHLDTIYLEDGDDLVVVDARTKKEHDVNERDDGSVVLVPREDESP